MDLYWIVILSTLSWVIIQSDGGTCRSSEDCLYQDLFTGYNVYTRPRALPSEKVEVTVVFTPNSLASIDEKNEVMNLVAIMHAVWTDPYLQWEPGLYNNTEVLNVPADQVWRPRIAILNSADKFFKRSHKEDFFALISSDGLISWSFGGTFSTTCSLDITRYPYDSQSCSLQLYNWGYSGDSVLLKTGGEVDTVSFANNSVWDLVDTSAESIQYFANNKSYIGIEFTLHWKRKVRYYIFNMVLPIILLLLVSLGIFWLPPESGERISLAITVLLSYTVFLIVIMDTTPINSETVPLLSRFVMLVMASTTFTLLQSLLMVNLSMHTKPPPSWLKTLAFHYLARLFCLREDIPVTEDEREHKETEHVGTNKVGPELQIKDMDTAVVQTNCKIQPQNTGQDLLTIMSALLQIQQERILSEQRSAQWKLIGKILDRLFFVVTAIATVVAISVIFLQ